MNKLLWFCLFVLVYSCTNSDHNNSQTASSKTEYRGLIIDPAIKGKVPKKEGDQNSLSFVTLEIKMFENDKPVNRPLLTSSGLPCYAMAFYPDDSLRLTFVPILPAFGLYVQKYKDSCRVSYAFSMHEESTGPYRLHPTDSLTHPGLVVPCRFTIILDRPEYKRNDFVYGFLEGISDNYYTKTNTVDTKTRVEFKGYFRAQVMEDKRIINQ
ncbi:MAG TPA: hypothetical protein VFI06_14260 [Chitinophagaceae bacterium]|nr:hypothetical protein [Chitinophagaceae bacterium]